MKKVFAGLLTALILASLAGKVQADGSDLVPKETILALNFVGSSKPVATFTVNGKARRLLLDTGSATCALSERIIREEHIETHAEIVRRKTIQVTNEVPVTSGSLKLAIPFVVVAQKQLARAMGSEQIDGILGANFLEFFTAIFDFPGKKMTLIFPAGASDDVLKHYDFQDAARVSTTDPESTGRHSVSAVFSQKDKRITESMVVDTGANGTLISTETARDLGLLLFGNRLATAQGGAVTMRQSRTEKIQLGDLTLTVADIYVGETKDSNIFTPLLGMDILSHYKMLLDYKTHSLWLKK